MLRSMLAETPLVRNLDNPAYMKILLNGKPSLEAVFASIDIHTLRQEFRKAHDSPQRIPTELKPLIAISNFPEKLLNTIQKTAA